MTSDLLGTEEMLESLARLIPVSERRARQAVEIILSEMRDYAKDFAPYGDITGNLRNSTQYEMDPPPKAAGTLYAGMEYAIYVERRDGYWVLQGAVDHFEPIIDRIFKGKMTIRKQELDSKFRPIPIIGGET